MKFSTKKMGVNFFPAKKPKPGGGVRGRFDKRPYFSPLFFLNPSLNQHDKCVAAAKPLWNRWWIVPPLTFLLLKYFCRADREKAWLGIVSAHAGHRRHGEPINKQACKSHKTCEHVAPFKLKPRASVSRKPQILNLIVVTRFGKNNKLVRLSKRGLKFNLNVISWKDSSKEG